jgi:hypothetical protein
VEESRISGLALSTAHKAAGHREEAPVLIWIQKAAAGREWLVVTALCVIAALAANAK